MPWKAVLFAVITAWSATAGAQEATSPIPAGNPGEWANSADYPSSALREDIEGVVRFVLGVAADGRVTDCSVSETSGDQALDAKTCELMMARARFEPARNADGQPTTGTWSSSVRWEIPDSEQSLPIPQLVTYRLTVEKDGSLSACDVLADNEQEVGKAVCKRAAPLTYEPALDSDGVPQRAEFTVTFEVKKSVLPD